MLQKFRDTCIQLAQFSRFRSFGFASCKIPATLFGGAWLDHFLCLISTIYLIRIFTLDVSVLSLQAPEAFPGEGIFHPIRLILLFLYNLNFEHYFFYLLVLKILSFIVFALVFLRVKIRISVPLGLFLSLLIEGSISSFAATNMAQLRVTIYLLMFTAIVLMFFGEKTIRSEETKFKNSLLIILIATYFSAGYNKLILGDGIGWINGEAFYHLVKVTHDSCVGSPIALLDYFPKNPTFWFVIAAGTIAIEVFSPLALFNNKMKNLFLSSFLLLHLGILATMRISFIDVSLICLFFIFTLQLAPQKLQLGGFKLPLFAILIFQTIVTVKGSDFFPLLAMKMYPETRVYLKNEAVLSLEIRDKNGKILAVDFGKVWDHHFTRSFHLLKSIGDRRPKNKVSIPLIRYLFERCQERDPQCKNIDSFTILDTLYDLETQTPKTIVSSRTYSLKEIQPSRSQFE
jgi:hypothetical protein